MRNMFRRMKFIQVGKLIGSSLKSIKNPKLFFVLLLEISLVGGVLTLLYFTLFPSYVKNNVRYTRNKLGEIISIERIPTPRDPKDKQVTAKVSSSENLNYWEIIDTSKTPAFATGLKFYEKQNRPPVLQWHEYLIGIQEEYFVYEGQRGTFDDETVMIQTLQSQIRGVRVYNTKTGESYDISLDMPRWGEIWYVNAQIVDNTFYFGLGGAFGPSLRYALALPPRRISRIVKPSGDLGNEIVKIGNTYISHFCYEGCTYELFNPFAMTTSPLNRMTQASNGRDIERKEEFIGIDDKGNMIVRVRNVSGQKYPFNYETKMIAAVPLRDETHTVPLLQANELPEEITHYFMIDGLDKILMFGKSKTYVYNIRDRKFTEIILDISMRDNPKTYNREYNTYSYTKSERLICFITDQSPLYGLDLVSIQSIQDSLEACPKPNPNRDQKSAELLFADLQLPNHFRLNFVTSSYDLYKVTSQWISELPPGAEIITPPAK